MKLDQKDLAILDLLQEDSSLSTRKIAKKILLPITTVHNRIKKLRNEGVIKKYSLELDHKKIGNNLSAYVLIKMEYKALLKKSEGQLDLAGAVRKMRQVRHINYVTGPYDAVIFARFKDIDDLNSFVTGQICKMEGIRDTITFLVLKEG